MLQLLLQLISDGRLVSLAELARELGLSQALVEMMVADLVRTGYLRPAGGCADSPCEGCNTNRMCIRSEMRLWVSTGKAFPG